MRTYTPKQNDPITCTCCGETFVPKRTDAKFCSPGCRLTQHRAEIKQAKVAAKNQRQAATIQRLPESLVRILQEIDPQLAKVVTEREALARTMGRVS